MSLRPIDELDEHAQVGLRSAPGCLWLVDAAGVEYRPPAWLCRLLRVAEGVGEERLRADLRAALGITASIDLIRDRKHAHDLAAPIHVQGELAGIATQLAAGDVVIIDPSTIVARRIIAAVQGAGRLEQAASTAQYEACDGHRPADGST